MSSTNWPPELPEEKLATLISTANDWALSHGLVLRAPAVSSHLPPSGGSAIHGPYSLFPTPFPRSMFERATELQDIYNDLYARVTLNREFLRKVIGGNVQKVDAFQRSLYEIWEKLEKDEGTQRLHLGLFRSDYMLHAGEGQDVSLKQVEFNTISSSFGALSSKVTELHRYLLQSGAFPPDLKMDLSSLPPNNALLTLAHGLSEAHRAYGNDSLAIALPVSSASILFVVQPNERNAFDQRTLEYLLLSKYNIRVIRQTFAQLAKSATFSTHTHRLTLDASTHSVAHEISVVYYRAGYTPDDYPSHNEWHIRELIERSRAIKCPSIALQLAGAKKVQQVLSEPGVLEELGIGSRESNLLRESWMDMYPMDDSDLGKKALKLAHEESERFVLKPQREGGGNNIYRTKIPNFLAGLEKKDLEKAAGEAREREGYILMELIKPPAQKSLLIKSGLEEATVGETISELGIFGVCLFGTEAVKVNESGGHLLRTKGKESDEGGVAVGFSVIDSPWLV
ncbi:glutathione synthase [Atractiella rhizophila]|nr:glutathione synthase [Atractiella rhizophila]